MTGIPQSHGKPILIALADTIRENKQYLSDIDGQIGDGDHGINMNKGFSTFAQALPDGDVELSDGLLSLSRVLMTQIGGSMGPLYGMFFRSMAKPAVGKQLIDAATFGEMLHSGREGIGNVSEAQPGDKTLMDALVPADDAYQAALSAGTDFAGCLAEMSKAARDGRDATKDMTAKVGRSSRLGERSRGVVDAGAASCCLILETFDKAFRTAADSTADG